MAQNRLNNSLDMMCSYRYILNSYMCNFVHSYVASYVDEPSIVESFILLAT